VFEKYLLILLSRKMITSTKIFNNSEDDTESIADKNRRINLISYSGRY